MSSPKEFALAAAFVTLLCFAGAGVDVAGTAIGAPKSIVYAFASAVGFFSAQWFAPWRR